MGDHKEHKIVMAGSNAVSPASGSNRSSRSSSRKSSVDQGYNPPPPQDDDDSGFFILKLLLVIGVLGAVFGAGIGVGAAIWNEECVGGDGGNGGDGQIGDDLTTPAFNGTTEFYTGTMPTETFGTDGTTELGTTESYTATGTGTATMETATEQTTTTPPEDGGQDGGFFRFRRFD